MVYRSRRDGEHGDGCKRREHRHQQKHSTLRQGPADGARDGCNRDIAGVIEGGVAAHAARQLGAPVKAQGERGDGGSEHVSDHRHQAV